MPILGNLSEFPLPEVLLLIGTRTGRLRLLDVPEFGMMEIDFSNGGVQAMHLGGRTYTDETDMVGKLSAVVQAQSGMFEFRLHPVTSIDREEPMQASRLVMSLVFHVDEQLLRQRMSASPKHWYILEAYPPEIWIEPELNLFFLQARPHLTTGIHLDELTQIMELDVSTVHQNLTNLRLLGLIKLIDGTEVPPASTQFEVEEKISRLNNDFVRAQRAASEINKHTSRLPMVKKLS